MRYRQTSAMACKNFVYCMTGNTTHFKFFFVPLKWACGGAEVKACTTNRKVMGSIPDGVTGIFHSHKSSGHTLALGVEAAGG
jgi:hypothetical protein